MNKQRIAGMGLGISLFSLLGFRVREWGSEGRQADRQARYTNSFFTLLLDNLYVDSDGRNKSS